MMGSACRFMVAGLFVWRYFRLQVRHTFPHLIMVDGMRPSSSAPGSLRPRAPPDLRITVSLRHHAQRV